MPYINTVLCLTFFIPYIEKHETKKHQMYYETFFFKGRLFICHIFITQNKRRGNLCTDVPPHRLRRGNFVHRETNLAQGTGKRGTLVSALLRTLRRSGESPQGESRLADELCKEISKAQSLNIKQRFAKGVQRNITDFFRLE